VIFDLRCKLKISETMHLAVKNSDPISDMGNGPKVFGVVLAGGRSTRMGEDKARLVVEGVPLWERQARLLKGADVPAVIVSGSTSGPWAGSGFRVVQDDLPGIGPAAGIFSALRELPADFIIVVAVDMPRMDPGFLASLLQQAISQGVGVVPRVNGRWEPLAAVYTRSVLPLLKERIRLEKFSLQEFVDEAVSLGFLAGLQCSGENAGDRFLNLNTQDEWRSYIRRK
jgi:molybdopterin-guanine dinucleotide biosynthesis protein A